MWNRKKPEEVPSKPIPTYPPGSHAFLPLRHNDDHVAKHYIVICVCSCGMQHPCSPSDTITL